MWSRGRACRWCYATVSRTCGSAGTGRSAALAAAGYRVIAPDMRGMGQTEAPADVAAYDIEHITGDLLGLLDHIGEERAVFAGLDFGAFAIYDLALRHPERVIAVIGLENPAAPHNPEESPLTEYRRMGEQHFMHIEYFRVPPRADEELAAQPRRFFHKVFHTLSGAGNYFDVFKYPPETSYIDAMAEPPPLPWPWLSELELEFLCLSIVAAALPAGLTGIAPSTSSGSSANPLRVYRVRCRLIFWAVSTTWTWKASTGTTPLA